MTLLPEPAGPSMAIVRGGPADGRSDTSGIVHGAQKRPSCPRDIFTRVSIPTRQPDRELVDRVMARVEEARVRFINLQFTDVVGMVKSVTIPAEKLDDAIRDGTWFDGSSIEGFARIAESDMYLVPDLDTFALIPWDTQDVTARLICWVYSPSGDLFPGDPRAALYRAIDEARTLGYTFNTGPE